VAKGTGIDTPDNDHVHHRLVRLGHGPRRTVVILWTWTAALSGFVLYPLFAPASNAIIPFAAILLGLLLFTLFRPGLRNGHRREPRRLRRAAPKPAASAEAEAAALVTAAPVVEAGPRATTAAGNGAAPTNHAPSRIVAAPKDGGQTPETALN
jgi:UDP-GlcNAc:undecaprenyl-phosphate GlcNAc-1-phosphate transferase